MEGLLLIVLLTCSRGLAADDCTRANAIDVQVIGKTYMPMACLKGGAMKAGYDQSVDSQNYCVVRCERRKNI